MLDFQKRYPSKILLFGEYSILLGATALSIPYSKFYGHWKSTEETDELLLPFFNFLLDEDWDYPKVKFLKDKLEQNMASGISFESNIKIGYGLGSSGALTAAVFDQFFEKADLSLEETKDILAHIEGHFHGKSSGLDSLTIYLNQAITQNNKQELRLIDGPIELPTGQFFLLDTGKSRSTARLVNYFLEEIKDNPVHQESLQRLSVSNNDLIDMSIKGDNTGFWNKFNEVSQIQYDIFNKMIPKSQEHIWLEGLNKGQYLLKLLGAGGGGYLLGYTQNPESLKLLKDTYLINHS